MPVPKNMTPSAYLEKSGCYVSAPLRMLYANLLEPRKQRPGQGNASSDKAKYDILLLVPKAADMSAINKGVKETAIKKFGEKEAGYVKRPMRKIDEESRTAAKIREALEKEGTLGDYIGFISCNTTDKPDVRHPNKEQLKPDQFRTECYIGRWCRITGNPGAYDTNGNRGVSFYLRNVQLLDHDEPLDLGRPQSNADEEFDAVDVGALQQGGKNGRQPEPAGADSVWDD